LTINREITGVYSSDLIAGWTKKVYEEPVLSVFDLMVQIFEVHPAGAQRPVVWLFFSGTNNLAGLL
jgi:hypothetical protein